MKKPKTALKTSLFEAIMPFSIALAMMVFVIMPKATHAATMYYYDLPTGQGCYANGQSYSGCGSSAYSYGQPYGTNPCSTCGGYGQAYGQGYGPYGSSQYNNANNYPYYTYQYYTNPNPYGVGTNNYGNNNGYAPYTPATANFTPYPYPEYVQYVRQADGTYRLGSPKQIPTYAWNADNSIPANAYGSVYGNGYGTGATTPYYGGSYNPYGSYGTYPYYR